MQFPDKYLDIFAHYALNYSIFLINDWYVSWIKSIKTEMSFYVSNNNQYKCGCMCCW